jgi:hypothetical protein
LRARGKVMWSGPRSASATCDSEQVVQALRQINSFTLPPGFVTVDRR